MRSTHGGSRQVRRELRQRPGGASWPTLQLVANMAGAGMIPQPFDINSCGERFRRGDFRCDAIGVTFSKEDDGIAFVNWSESVYDVAMSDDDRQHARRPVVGVQQNILERSLHSFGRMFRTRIDQAEI